MKRNLLEHYPEIPRSPSTYFPPLDDEDDIEYPEEDEEDYE